jgi:hypothetical protein
MLYLKDVYLINILIYIQNMNGNVKKNIYEYHFHEEDYNNYKDMDDIIECIDDELE